MNKKKVIILSIGIILILLIIAITTITLISANNMKKEANAYLYKQYNTHYDLKLIGIGNKRNSLNIEFFGPLAGYSTDKNIKRYVYSYNAAASDNNTDGLHYITVWVDKNTKHMRFEEINGNLPISSVSFGNN